VRLRGGFWVTEHFADCIERTPMPSEYAGSVTVRKLARLGLLDQLSYGRATLTPAGAEALERCNDQ
jgi:hypothetical protein